MKTKTIALFGALATCGCWSSLGAATLADSVNAGSAADDGAYWGVYDAGWLYTPSTSYLLGGIDTKFSYPNLTSIQDRNVTVALYLNNTPGNGGSLLGSFSFFSDNVAHGQTFVGGDFPTPIALVAGQQYFVGFENVGPLPPNSPPNQNDLGVNFTADPGGTFLSNLFFDVSSNPSCNTGTNFACEDTNHDILGQPILEFFAAPPASTTPEPATFVMFGGAMLVAAILRRAYAPTRSRLRSGRSYCLTLHRSEPRA
jgi:hypothetical protein